MNQACTNIFLFFLIFLYYVGTLLCYLLFMSDKKKTEKKQNSFLGKKEYAFFEELINTPSPTGFEYTGQKVWVDYIKPFVDKLEQQIMFAEKSWGSFRVLDVETGSLTIKVTLNEGHSMNYHNHKHRDEVWVVISGDGRTVIDGVEKCVKVGDVVTMPAGCCHTVMAQTELKLIEVQIGKDISVLDKEKVER